MLIIVIRRFPAATTILGQPVTMKYLVSRLSIDA
tara:strand:+ start:996 stop:1097 length:102 start_codon:yes stop_codon:yes gene_type:complete